jgi:hypothetical protein
VYRRTLGSPVPPPTNRKNKNANSRPLCIPFWARQRSDRFPTPTALPLFPTPRTPRSCSDVHRGAFAFRVRFCFYFPDFLQKELNVPLVRQTLSVSSGSPNISSPISSLWSPLQQLRVQVGWVCPELGVWLAAGQLPFYNLYYPLPPFTRRCLDVALAAGMVTDG